MGRKKKGMLNAIVTGAVAIGVALVVEVVGWGQYIATYLTTPYPQNEVWKDMGIIVVVIVGSWSIYMAKAESRRRQ